MDRGLGGGRYQTRTDDLFRVKEARYQLRQSPEAPRSNRFDTIRTPGGFLTTGGVHACDTRGLRSFLHLRERRVKSMESPGQPGRHADVAQLVAHHLAKVRVASSSLVIRSSAGISFGGSRRGRTTHGGVAERLGTGLQSRLHGFESRRHLHSRSRPEFDSGDWRSGSALP